MSWELVAPILRLKDTKRRTLDIARAHWSIYPNSKYPKPAARRYLVREILVRQYI
jgi:hypothetical protein